jgi:acyl-CoA thioesterase I
MKGTHPMRSWRPWRECMSALLLLVSLGVWSAPVRIVPIGDSITQGGKREAKQYTYRWPLARMLEDEGVEFEFIGTRTEGVDPDARWPGPFDADHEGYYGATSAYVRDRLRDDLPRLPPPDIALIDLGTNDDPDDIVNATIRPLEDIVAMLRARNPQVAVCVALIPAKALRGFFLHLRVTAAAKRLSTAESPVVAVAQDVGWNADPQDPSGDTFDGVHPNLKGQRKMAEQWLSAMRPLIAARQRAANRADDVLVRAGAAR